jgi:hypothetical protein
MHYMVVEAGDGTENDPIEIPHVSNHTIIKVDFIGSLDTHVYLHLPDDADIGDLFEMTTLFNIQLNIVNANVLGIASAQAYRTVLSVRKVLDNSETTDRTWLGSMSVKPWWL